MEVTWSSETFVCYRMTTYLNNPEDRILKLHPHGNVKCRGIYVVNLLKQTSPRNQLRESIQFRDLASHSVGYMICYMKERICKTV
jgi:hypothetical protein